MKRSRKSNRVTWAQGLNLCQVRLFLAEDCPSKIGTHTQDHLQKKASWMLHRLTGNEITDLPPGFDGGHFKHLKEKSSNIPKSEWKCPPKVVLSHNWHVAAGEESLEAEAQKVRETSVLEAVFPRHSAIPPSPTISLDVEEEFYNDDFTPRIPLNPIEEGAVADIPSDLSASPNTLNFQSPELPQDLSHTNSAECNTAAVEAPASEKPMLGLLPDLGADLVTAASAAATALMKSMEKESLIDTDLLVKILSDPKMVEKLITDRLAPMPVSKSVTKSIPPSCPKPVLISAAPTDGNFYYSPSVLQPAPKPMTTSVSLSNHNSPMVSVPMPANGSLQPTITKPMPGMKSNQFPSTLGMMPVQLNGNLQDNIAAIKTNPVKDINYFKNLIREHGSVKQNENISYNGPNPNQILMKEFGQSMRPKFQKPCMYYRSPKGCRNGSNCPYQHDISFQFQTGGNLEPPYKKMKFDGEIIGRT